METIGDRLNRLRRERDMTLENVGNAINVSKVTVSRYESGQREPKVETLKKLAKCFKVTPEYILTGEDSINSEDLNSTIDKFINELGDLDRLDMFIQLYNNPTLINKLKLLNNSITKCIQTYDDGIKGLNLKNKGE